MGCLLRHMVCIYKIFYLLFVSATFKLAMLKVKPLQIFI